MFFSFITIHLRPSASFSFLGAAPVVSSPMQPVHRRRFRILEFRQTKSGCSQIFQRYFLSHTNFFLCFSSDFRGLLALFLGGSAISIIEFLGLMIVKQTTRRPVMLMLGANPHVIKPQGFKVRPVRTTNVGTKYYYDLIYVYKNKLAILYDYSINYVSESHCYNWVRFECVLARRLAGFWFFLCHMYCVISYI